MVLADAAGLGGETTVAATEPLPPVETGATRAAAAGGGLRPRRALRATRGRRRHAVRGSRRRGAVARLGVRRRPAWHDPHQRPRDHERGHVGERAPGPRRLRRVSRRRTRPGDDRGLGPLQRRRRGAGQAGRPRRPARAARRFGRGSRRGARGRDRKPVRESDLARGRCRVGHRPVDRLAHLEVLGGRRDPDRRPDQPGELGRPAVRRAWPRDRHQRADPVELRNRGGGRVRDPDQRRAARPVAARADAARCPTRISGSRRRT